MGHQQTYRIAQVAHYLPGKDKFCASALWRDLRVAADARVAGVADVARADAPVTDHRAAGVETALGHAGKAKLLISATLPRGTFLKNQP